MTTRHLYKHKKTVLLISLSLLWGQATTQLHAQSTDIANVPMAVSNMVTPNVLVVYDNSKSMDAHMNGTMVSGNNPNTRGNIGRTVMRNSISTYANAFNWGLMSYGMVTNPPPMRNIYAQYFGTDASMVFSSNCTGFIPGVFNGAPAVSGTSMPTGLRCIANPESTAGREFITFRYSGDDANINDVLYWGAYTGVPGFNQVWVPAVNNNNPTHYRFFNNRNPVAVDGWDGAAGGDFLNGLGTFTFNPTDAGWVPGNFGADPNNLTRSLYLPRGWGYISAITGVGRLNRQVMVESPGHQGALQAWLANETDNPLTGELKNGALFTPLRGTLDTANSYFSNTLGGGNPTPVSQVCQQNFVMLVTDGLPTGNNAGALYSAGDRTNTCLWSTVTNSCTSGTLGTAATDAITSVGALRATTVGGFASSRRDGTGAVTGRYDVQTYVVALGDGVANPFAISVMDAMAFSGGTERALPAANAAQFQQAMNSISDDITAKVGSGSAVAVANAHVTSTDNASFASSYNSGTWSGDLDSFSINIVTGVPTTTSLWISGSAAVQLDLRTPASRFIATSVDTPGAIGGVQFQPALAPTPTKLSVAQQTLLNTPLMTDGAAVLAYLRGDRSGETATTYRARSRLLGDVINGEPLLVRPPSANYADAGYSAFKSSNAGRTRMLFQGANDGMLHAFNAATGAEAWAYVPNLVMGNLNNLSRRPGFTHQYYVDGTPVEGDVDFRNVDGASGPPTPDWRTILVGGLGKGGRGYYALDISTTTAANEVDVKNKVLWEFPNSITNPAARNAARLNMGFSYGKPIIVKADGKWVVLITSGYNNGTNPGDSGGDGLGRLYVVNPKTGDLIKAIPTPACATVPTTSPCGLAQISAYVESASNNDTDYVYGGDLKGNVWRFDLSGNVGSWGVNLFTTLRDASNNTQPITIAPELTSIKISGADSRMVFIATGQYLGNSDVATTQTQTMYGLRDSLVALPAALRTNLQQQTFTFTTTFRVSSNNAVNYVTKKGWYIDLPSSGERVNTDPTIALNTLVFTSNIPSPVACVPGGSSWQYFINVRTGGLADNSTVPWSGTFLGNALASRPVLIQLPSGKVVSLIRTSDGQTIKQDVPVSPAGTAPRRISWRELFN